MRECDKKWIKSTPDKPINLSSLSGVVGLKHKIICYRSTFTILTNINLCQFTEVLYTKTPRKLLSIRWLIH